MSHRVAVSAIVCLLALCGLRSAGAQSGPENDGCDRPTVLSDGVHFFSTDGATTDGPNESDCSTFGSEQIWNDIWFEYVAPMDGVLVISTCDTVDFDTRIAVYSGACGSLVEHACNDDGVNCSGYSSHLLASCQTGERYLVRVGAYAEGVTGSGSIGIKASEPCALGCPGGGASEVENCSSDENGGCGPDGPETESLEFGVPICGTWYVQGNQRDTDYYSVTVPENGGILEIDLLSSDEIVGYVYLTRSTCPPLVLGYAFGGCPTFMRTGWLEPGEYHLVAAPGFERRISCDGPNGHQNYILTASLLVDEPEVPDNDDCEQAQVVGAGSWPFSTILSETDGSSDSPPECGSFGTSIGSDVWFEHTPTCSGGIVVSLCQDTDFDSRLEIWEGGCDGTLIACNDDGGSCGYASELVFDGECGVAYLIRVGGYAGASGTGVLEVQCAGGSSACCPADLDGNGEVSGSDLSLILGSWGTSDENADLDGDGLVGGSDLALVLGAWGGC